MQVYRGEGVAGGVALGRVFLQGYPAGDGHHARIPSDEVENELNRLRDAVARSRQRLEEMRAKQQETMQPDELRIFDVHLSYLADPLFIDEIEKQILNERFTVRGAIGQLVARYDRLVSLVESEQLQQRAGDFRDVGIRLLRNLVDKGEAVEFGERPEGRCILAAARLTTADLFDLETGGIDGIVAEEGGISSHAAILARSMGIPTVTGIRDLVSKLENGAFVVVDAGAGEVVVKPSEDQVARYQEAAARFQAERVERPSGDREHALRDGAELRIYGSCGSPGEVRLAQTYGMDGIGVYRTELLFLSERRLPSEDELIEHYREVVHQPGGAPAHVRLLDISSTLGLGGEEPAHERNPAMGARGVRYLRAHPDLLRLQLRAILRAAVGTRATALLVPFVTGVSDLAQVKAAILDERQSLRKRDVPCAETLRVAPIVEVPAAAFMLTTFLTHSDFVVVALDDLQAHLLAADRDNLKVREYHEMVHPALFELLSRMAKDVTKKKQRLVLFGERAGDPRLLPLFLGLGIRDLSVAPVRMEGVLKVLARYTSDECRLLAERVLQAPRALDIERILVQLEG